MSKLFVSFPQSLHHLGLSHVLKTYLKGVKKSSTDPEEGGDEVREYLYETAWRCSQWSSDLQVENVETGGSGFHQSVFSCLTSLRDGEMASLQESLKEARSSKLMIYLHTFFLSFPAFFYPLNVFSLFHRLFLYRI